MASITYYLIKSKGFFSRQWPDTAVTQPSLNIRDIFDASVRAVKISSSDSIQTQSLVGQGNFERAIETAGEHGPELKHKYVALQATNFIRDGKTLDALKLYRRHSAPPYEQASISIWVRSGLMSIKFMLFMLAVIPLGMSICPN